MDFGVLGWLGSSLCMIFNGSDEYIVKKYLEKRWVASTKLPDIPANKVYRRQESTVIDFVSSGKLDLHHVNPFNQVRSFQLLKNENNEERIHQSVGKTTLVAYPSQEERISQSEIIPEIHFADNTKHSDAHVPNKPDLADITTPAIHLDTYLPVSFTYTDMDSQSSIEVQNFLDTNAWLSGEGSAMRSSSGGNLEIGLDKVAVIMVCDTGTQTN